MHLQRINYWLDFISNDVGTFKNVDIVRDIFSKIYSLDNVFFYELEGGKGICICLLDHSLLGELAMNELCMYIKPEFRGNFSLFKQLVNFIEEKAKELGASSVMIGSNIGYKDRSVITALKRLGYDQANIVTKRV